MGVIQHEIAHERAVEADVIRVNENVIRPHHSSALRIAVGTGAASGVALIFVFVVGLPVLAAGALGAAVGGGAVALLAAHSTR